MNDRYQLLELRLGDEHGKRVPAGLGIRILENGSGMTPVDSARVYDREKLAEVTLYSGTEEFDSFRKSLS